LFSSKIIMVLELETIPKSVIIPGNESRILLKAENRE